MKNIANYKILMMMTLAFLFFNCSTDDNDDDQMDDVQPAAQVEEEVTEGTWRITEFIDSGDNETALFAGFNFTFNTDGTLIATNDTDTLEGTWSITSDDDDDDDDNDLDFNIFFPVPDSNDFEELNDDWDIVSSSSTRIELEDISDDDPEIDSLIFERN